MSEVPSDRTEAVTASLVADPAGERRALVGMGGSLEWVLRSLLRIRGVDETASVIVDLVRAATSARWAALYVSEPGEPYLLRTRSPERHEALGAAVDPKLAASVLGHGQFPVRCDDLIAAREAIAPDLSILAPLRPGDGSVALLALGPAADGVEFDEESLNVVHRIADACSIAIENSRVLSELRAQVFVDFLTGCMNRRGFDARMEVEVARSRRYGRPVSLLLLDVDRFKWINDSMGHPVGDYALRRLGDFLVGSFRTTDGVFRFGGDEFALIFPETPKEEAERMADRLRVQIAALFPDEVMRRGITVSVGVAAMPTDAVDAEALLEAADRALYRAKGTGKNRVIRA